MSDLSGKSTVFFFLPINGFFIFVKKITICLKFRDDNTVEKYETDGRWGCLYFSVYCYCTEEK